MKEEKREELRKMWKEYKRVFSLEGLMTMRDFWWENWGRYNGLKIIKEEFMSLEINPPIKKAK